MTDKQMTSSNNGSPELVASAAVQRGATPAVDIYETGDDLVLIADLPGVQEADLQLEVSQGVLTLEAPIHTGGDEPSHRFYRQFKLSERIDGGAGEAALKDGVLTLRLPKVAEAKPKKIVVKTLH
jgi:HSP20 family molecular chaperone IbpA